MGVKDIIREVTEDIQKNAGVKAVFGEPYEKGKFTVIPVAKVSIRGCGCGGTGNENEEPEKKTRTKPVGMGMYIKNTPVGYIEIDEEGACFVEIVEQSGVIKAGMVLGAFAIFSFTRIFMKLLKR